MENLKNKKLWVMVGIPGSGKSTWIKNHKDKVEGTSKVVSRDAIRFALVAEDEDYFSKEKEVFRKFIEEIKDGLANYDNTFVDATHLSPGSRRKLFNNLGHSLDDAYVHAVVINPSLETTLRQNAQRTGRCFVPEDVIINYKENFSYPKPEEGFDEILYYDERGLAGHLYC